MKVEIALNDFVFVDGDRELLADMREEARRKGVFRLRGVDGDESKYRIYLALPEEHSEKLSAAWQNYKENKTFFKYDASACRLSLPLDAGVAERMGAALRELQVSEHPKCGCRAAELYALAEA